jgi:hypothetical protein
LEAVFSVPSAPRLYNEDQRFVHGFQFSLCIRLCNRIMQATSRRIQKHENGHIRGIGQGEARRRKYKGLKLGGGQAYDLLSD